MALRDVSRFVDEFSLRLVEPEDVAFSEMPDVDEATDRRKQFRYAFYGGCCRELSRPSHPTVKAPSQRRGYRGPNECLREPSGSQGAHRRDV